VAKYLATILNDFTAVASLDTQLVNYAEWHSWQRDSRVCTVMVMETLTVDPVSNMNKAIRAQGNRPYPDVYLHIVASATI
jgi:hypothetical protein